MVTSINPSLTDFMFIENTNNQNTLNVYSTFIGSGSIEDPYIDDLWFKDSQGKVHKVQSGNSIALQPFEGEVFEG